MQLYQSIDESNTGKQFGDWTQVGPAFLTEVDNSRRRLCICECKCGRVEAINYGNLLRGKSTGCRGCRGAKISERTKQHGMSHTRVHEIWWGIVVRCTYPSRKCWKDYGGRGITICDRWRNSFQAFLDDVGHPPTDQHSIDRIDCDGNYEPGNVRWATRLEQGANKRRNRRFQYKGREIGSRELSEITGIPAKTVAERARKGWTAEQIAEIPVSGGGYVAKALLNNRSSR